jgi:hypothetical protein
MNTLEQRVGSLEDRVTELEKNMTWFMTQFHIITGDERSVEYQTMIPGFRPFMYGTVEGKEYLSTLVYKQFWANNLVQINDGWWEYSEIEWLSKVGLTAHKTRTYENYLIQLNVLEVKRKKSKSVVDGKSGTVKHYRLSIDALCNVMMQFYNHPQLPEMVTNKINGKLPVSKQEYLINSEFYPLFLSEFSDTATTPQSNKPTATKAPQKHEKKAKLKYIAIFYEEMVAQIPSIFTMSVDTKTYLNMVNYPGGNKNYVTVNAEKKVHELLQKAYPGKGDEELYTMFRSCCNVWLNHEQFQWEKIHKVDVKCNFASMVRNLDKILPRIKQTNVVKQPKIRF